ncbi:MAG TPA: arabinan endo-1,5-alpha-L-arabinosidase [Chthonomonadaceae bacterium]|nr:arabinan endo-1,5-alpha-L-arabinosidase [Chthonomonadaceae bacterium]
MNRRQVLSKALTLVMLTTARTLVEAEETDLSLHDPSTLVKEGDTYWVFGTGRGCLSFSSTDRIHWTPRGSVFPMSPDWVKEVVPGNTRNSIWAPDVRYIRGKYYLYYTVSTFGRNVSAIGLATSPTLDPLAWVDHGVVIRSEAQDNFNAIDPGVTLGPDGRLWLVFGSFWGGIQMIELHPATGRRLYPTSPLYTLAKHPQDPKNAIEAPFLYYHAGYYYLFVNWDYCCRGRRSTYNIRVGRSAHVIGPYRDRDGVEMLRGGGTLLLGSVPDMGSGAPFDAKVGPGHAGILSDNGVDRFSCHYEYVREKGGKSMLEIRTVTWDRDGWPQIAPGK